NTVISFSACLSPWACAATRPFSQAVRAPSRSPLLCKALPSSFQAAEYRASSSTQLRRCAAALPASPASRQPLPRPKRSMGLSMPCASIFSSDSSIGDLLRNAASRQSRDRPCLQLLSVRLVDRAEKRLGALLLRIAEQLVGAALLMDAPFVEE